MKNMRKNTKNKLVEELAEIMLKCYGQGKEYLEANIKHILDKYEDHQIYKFGSGLMVDTFTNKTITEEGLKKLKEYTFVHIVD